MNETKWCKMESKWLTDFSQDFNEKARNVLLIGSWQYWRKRTVGRTYNEHFLPFVFFQVPVVGFKPLTLRSWLLCSTTVLLWNSHELKWNFVIINRLQRVTWENLKVFWDEFSTLSLAVFVVVSVMQCIHTHIHTLSYKTVKTYLNDWVKVSELITLFRALNIMIWMFFH